MLTAGAHGKQQGIDHRKLESLDYKMLLENERKCLFDSDDDPLRSECRQLMDVRLLSLPCGYCCYCLNRSYRLDDSSTIQTIHDR